MSVPLIIDRDDRMRVILSGEKAKEALGGLLTNDVASLTRGRGHRAAALTPKGRVIALCRVFDRGSDLLVDADAAAAEGFISMIKKFVNPRLAGYSVVTESTGCIGILGTGAATAIAGVFGSDVASELSADIEALSPFASRILGDVADPIVVIRSADFSAPGFELFGSRAHVHSVRTALVASGSRVVSVDEARVLRVEAGIPEWGTEIDADTIPQEALLDDLGAISFNKGCYTGQEVVARIHFRGHVNRLLRWLTSTSQLKVGARLVDADGKEVGQVRSSVVSPSRGPLAIAIVRREIEPGTAVQVLDGDHVTTAQVVRIA